MNGKRDAGSAVVRTVVAKGLKQTAQQVPGQLLVDGLHQMHKAYCDYQKLREEEQTKRGAILANRDATLEQIRAQRDVIKQALAASFELRKTGLQAQIQAMDKAIDSGNTEALHVVMDAMVKTIQDSPFKDLAELREQLTDKNFVLSLK